MTAAMAHRGPDGDGFHTEPHLALGHLRLAIVDLVGGVGVDRGVGVGDRNRLGSEAHDARVGERGGQRVGGGRDTSWVMDTAWGKRRRGAIVRQQCCSDRSQCCVK